MIFLPLSQGKVAVIDDQDSHLAIHKWSATKRDDVWYAKRRFKKSEGEGYIYLHVAIMGQVGVDHVDGDGLNCTRSNLRLANGTQNNANVPKRSTNKSGYKGVRWSSRPNDPIGRPWRAEIREKGRYHFLGQFSTKEEAARAYNEAAKKYFGEFAQLNDDV